MLTSSVSFCCLDAVSSVSSLRCPLLHCGPGDLRLLVLRPSVVFIQWLVTRCMTDTAPSPITFHDANAFYWSTAFKTPYTSTGSLVVDLLSEYMVALTCIETQHSAYKFYVLFLNWSCQKSQIKNQKSKECFFSSFWFLLLQQDWQLQFKNKTYIYI